MKKQRKAAPQKNRKTHGGAPGATVPRRDMLKLARNGTIAVLAAGAIGAFSVNAVRATVAEHDLNRIGQGLPTVVQIHDPQCSLCTALQRETRKALKAFDDSQVTYLVANITPVEGAQFAAKHGVQHVTLLLLDGRGAVQQVLQGVRQRDELRAVFARHIAGQR